MLSPVSFADVVNRTASTVEAHEEDDDEDLTRRASANEGWKSCDNSRNLWLDTLDDDCLSSDEDQNDSNYNSERNNVRFKKDCISSRTALFLILTTTSEWRKTGTRNPGFGYSQYHGEMG